MLYLKTDRSFKDAADYKADDGKKIAGTKNAKQDDFVSEDEFQLFCTYACSYAAMFDAFAKIDGGGAGRDANDDKRIEKDEWMTGFKGMAGYGFKAFEGMATKEDATAAFEKMDDNGGGIVLFDEWCQVRGRTLEQTGWRFFCVSNACLTALVRCLLACLQFLCVSRQHGS